MMRSLIAVLALLTTLPLWAANQVAGARVWPAQDNTRVVFDMGQTPRFSHFTLTNPHRLVIDVSNTSGAKGLPMAVADSRLVSKIRTSKAPKAGDTRLVLELTGPVSPRLFALGPSGSHGHRLVVDLKGPGVAVVPPAKPQTSRDIIIAIDAGHGGKDPGSIGPRGTQERHVTLAVSKRLANRINAVSGMKAVLIRSDDRFLEVKERANLACTHQADLLVSIHADSVASPKPRGASVWVLNNKRARREFLKRMKSQKEYASMPCVAQVIEDTEKERYLTQTLLDLTKDNSIEEGQDIGAQVLKELAKVTKLHKSRPQPNSLGVLTALEIPSLLVETGFISNPAEEKLLKTSRHQQRLADAIYRAIHNHFRSRPPAGTLFASNSGRVHVVRSGESLSVLAARYGTSVSAIKRANKLNGNMVRIGQKLTIPQS